MSWLLGLFYANCVVMLCYVNVMLCYVMLCYVMLCYVMLCYADYFISQSGPKLIISCLLLFVNCFYQERIHLDILLQQTKERRCFFLS